MSLKALLGALGCLLPLACGAPLGEPMEQTAESDQSIVGGILARDYPEGVFVDWHDGKHHVCTGALIAPRVVLTAGHCVVNVSGWVVRAPYAGNQEVKAIAGYVTDKTDDSARADQHDLGILILANPIALAQYPDLRLTPVPDGADVSTVGRDEGSDISMTELYKAPVTVRDGTSKGWPFHYLSRAVIRGGDSGGPVFLGGTHTIVAVNSIFRYFPSTQYLARVDLEREWVTKFVANPNANNCYVKGAILDKYRELGALSSALGDCVSNELTLPDGVGRASHFERGSIYWTPATGAHEIRGAIRAKYQSMGWETSALGYPVSDELVIPGGAQSNFQGGFITWSSATGAVTVTATP